MIPDFLFSLISLEYTVSLALYSESPIKTV
jgi:hypothetical protein